MEHIGNVTPATQFQPQPTMVDVRVTLQSHHPSEALKTDQIPQFRHNRRRTLRLGRPKSLSSIVMCFGWLFVAIHLSCRAFFRRSQLCCCRRFVSDHVSSPSYSQLDIIGLKIKWHFRQLSFLSTKWYGDVIWIFDLGIIWTWIDNESEWKKLLMQTSVRSPGLRHCLRIWWREIRLSLILRIDFDKFLPWFSLSIKEFGQPLVVNFNGCSWGCQHGTRFKRWCSLFHYLWALAITKKDVISRCWRYVVGKRCNRWITTIDCFKVYWSFVKKR
ncbi:PREDICTED: uncharacterized protein LOC104699294 [Camelina sativa]|uniref:Uncharacterized protein LOC104699294 n=1 Tax=Camelina sativa TaxID=90675 RepID=A0ABM0SLD2_CAMSA|nr:PREDICTED: uncharacterized protein LOC104699294 [Camelina sativa]